MSDPGLLRISFVCTGNICRSPMGEVIFRSLADRAGAADRFLITSRGTHGYHIGDGADPRTISALAAAGYDGGGHRAARLSDADIASHDLFIALDRGHERTMRDRGAQRIELLTAYDPDRPADPDVFDPYYSDRSVFDEVLLQVERSCERLLEELSSASSGGDGS